MQFEGLSFLVSPKHNKTAFNQPSWDTDHNFQNPEEKTTTANYQFHFVQNECNQNTFIQQNSKNYLQKYNKMRQYEAMNI